MWYGTKILGFKYIDIKTKGGGDDKDIVGITFSFSGDYINQVSELE